MAKQSKAAELSEKVETFKEQVNEVLKPLSASSDGQAPTLPFTPYVNDEYTEPFSTTLLEKANGLANKIWNGRDGYTAMQFPFPFCRTEEDKEVIEKNKTYFNYSTVVTALRRMFAIGVLNTDPTGFYDHMKIIEVIKKIKQLEKKHDQDELIDDHTREQIINNILIPSHMYGVYDQYYMPSANFRYPAQKSVVNGLLSNDDIQAIDSMISYIPRIRSLLGSFKPVTGQPVKAKRLLKNWMPDDKGFPTIEDDKRLLSDLSNTANFFNCALPYGVYTDLIPALKYPNASAQTYEKLKTASAELRDASIGYIQEQKPLSALLEAIRNLAEGLQAYFTAVANEVEASFNFISRIGLPFDKFVEESKSRIDNSGCPF